MCPPHIRSGEVRGHNAQGQVGDGTKVDRHTPTNAAGLPFIGPAPQVSKLTPGHGGIGAGVKIIGTHLSGTTAVSFGGVASASIVVVSDRKLVAQVPAGATTGPVTVTTPGVW